MEAGIYARVSTHDQHTLDMQIAAMKKYVLARENGRLKSKLLKLALVQKKDQNVMNYLIKQGADK